ncbi:hypothetical protein ACH5RR_029530 [Cinchona calisaya]|uniref:Uncharacterized protein n=1 Tax=Cinchona calisaya TaxID=153742 RepID=A0ABD2YV88_9GENT
MWTRHHTFRDTVEQSWSTPLQGVGMRILSENLKRLKIALRKWNKEIFGNVLDYILWAEAKVEQKEIDHQNNPSAENCQSLHQAQAKLSRHLRKEEMFACQKAKIKWLRNSDQILKFFHACSHEKNTKLTIHRI